MSIVVTNLSKAYQTSHGMRDVLHGVNFRVEMGQHFGILGRNGSGKSTLVRLLSGIEQPSKGSINRRMRVSWPLAFTGSFQGSLTGLDNLRFVARVYGAEAKKIAPFVEDFAELGSYFFEPVKTYSSGMVARLAFALSLAVNFDCFLIDEVIAVGDAKFQLKCHDELFNKRNHHAFLIVSHDVNVIRTYCKQAAVLETGMLQTFDNVDDAYLRYNSILGIAP